MSEVPVCGACRVGTRSPWPRALQLEGRRAGDASIPSLVETAATAISGDRVHVGVGIDGPEFLLDRGAQQGEWR